MCSWTKSEALDFMREEKTLGRIIALNVLFKLDLVGGDVNKSFEDILADIDGEFLYSLHINPHLWDKKGHSAKKMMINLQIDYAIDEIKRKIQDIYKKNRVTADSKFESMGIDSKGKFNLITSLEDVLPFFPNNVTPEEVEKIYSLRQAGDFAIRKSLEVLGLSKNAPVEKYTEDQKNALKDWYDKDLRFLAYVRELVLSFVRKIVIGVTKKSEEIRFKIEANCKNWKYDSIGNVEKNILRIAIYEMMFSKEKDVVDEVAIEQAVVISKMFCEEKGVKFINGVLSSVYKELNPVK